jgi:hypothetical protein
MQHNNDIYFERRMTTLEMEYKNITEKLDNLISSQSLLAKNSDLDNFVTRNEFNLAMVKIDNKIDRVINKAIWKIGALIVAFMTTYPFILQYFIHK